MVSEGLARTGPTDHSPNLTLNLLRPEKVVAIGVGLVLVPGRGRSAGQGGDLGQVVGEYSVPAPDRRSVPAVQACAVPAVASFEVADPAFAAGAPLDQLAEAAAVLDGLAGRGGGGLAGNRDRAHGRGVQVPFDGGLAVAAVGGHRAGHLAGAPGDPFHGGHQLRAVRDGTILHGVVHDDAVVVV
jgi:hypothetical protein